MSYWISLHDGSGETATVESFEEGGTYALGGSTKAGLNVTYNYSKYFDFKGLRDKKASDTIKKMQEALNDLGTEKSEDYWAPTKGNVGYTVNILLNWAKQFPQYIWRVS